MTSYFDFFNTCAEKPFSSFVVMEVILMVDFLKFSSFDGGKSDGWRKK